VFSRSGSDSAQGGHGHASVGAHGEVEELEHRAGAPAQGSDGAEPAAHASAVAHDDPLAHDFFQRSDRVDHDHVDDAYIIHSLSRGSRRAMYASVGIFAVSVLGIASYSIYQNWIMPAPVELGATAGDVLAVLPTPVPTQHHAPAMQTAAITGVQPPAAVATQALPAVTPPPAATPPSAAPPPPAAVAVREQPATAQPNSAQPSSVAVPGTETQLAAATNPTSPTSSTSQVAVPAAQTSSTLAMLAARQPASEEAPGGPAQVDGVLGAHLRANAVRAEQAAPANSATTAPSGAPVVAVAQADSRTAVSQAPSDAEKLAQAEPAVRSAPGSGPTYDELVAVGRAFSKKNKRIEASEAFRRALIQTPQGSAALSGLSFVYLNADEKQHAREYAQRAVQSDASNAEGWIVLGAALELLGDRAGAKDAYRNCVERGQGPYLTECRKVAR
jgi:hypothetical protein